MTKNSEKKIKILISCHKPTEYISNEIMQPIQLGCTNSDQKFEGMLYDNEGINISDKNPMYCELTAQYWAWKNLDLDYYGFCHYRRYFNFSDKKFSEDPYGNIIESYPGDFTVEKYGLSEENIRKAISDNDIIITERKNIRKMPGRAKTIIAQYKEAPLLRNKDIHLVLDIIEKKYPEYIEDAKRFLNGSITSFCNMYILKKEFFFEYCEWMFDLLDEFCKRTDMSDYSIEALRTPGHLSERLFGIYLTHLKRTKKNLKIKELQCVYFKNTDKQDMLSPVFEKNAIPVVLAANNNFVPMFATCLQSIIDNSSKKNNYDVVLIQSDVSTENKQTLLSMINDLENFSLRFFDASRLLADYKLEAKEHISVETYYRFLIQSAMPSYDKVLYIDCDLVVNADLADLYSENIDGYMLAAARDPDFSGQINGANKNTGRYAREILGLKNPFNYFQAGVILFNEKEMRKTYSLNEWLTFATKPYKYSDQDVLNIHCEEKVKYLDMSWNIITDCNRERIQKVIVFAPAYIQKEYFRARKNPKIIHYAGFMKPWYKPTEDFALLFWQYARRTPFYEQLLYIMNKKKLYKEINTLATNVSFKGKTKNRAKRLYRRIIPANTKVDKTIKTIIKK